MPASLVAVRWASSKYAGTVMTAWVTVSPRIGLGVALELHQRASRDLLRGVGLAVDVVGLPALAHVALDRAEGAIGVGDRLTLGDLADEHLAGLRERDDRRGRAGALGVGDDDGFAAFEDRDHRVGGSEVDADCLGHGVAPLGVSGVIRGDSCDSRTHDTALQPHRYGQINHIATSRVSFLSLFDLRIAVSVRVEQFRAERVRQQFRHRRRPRRARCGTPNARATSGPANSRIR